MKTSLSKNAVFYLIYNLLNVLFPFITGIYAARVLLPTDIGQVEVARNISNYFITFSLLGIPTYALRECSKLRSDKDGLSKLFSELFIINTLSVSAFLVLYFSLIISVPAYRENLPLFLITGFGITLNYLYVSWLYEGLERFDFISIRNIIFKALCFVLLIVFVHGSKDIYIYAAISVFGTAGNYLINFVFAKRYVRFTFSNLNLKKHVKPIIILALTYLAIELYSMVDITMLGWFCSKESVAFYVYASRIKSILLQIFNTFTIIVVPRLVLYFKNKNKEGFNSLLSKTLNIIIFLAVPSIVGIWFVSDSFLVSIYGEAYISTSIILKILSFTCLISPIGYLLGSRVCLITNNESKMLAPLIVGAVSNIILNAALIPIYDAAGAAIASVTSELLVALIYILRTRKYIFINIQFREYLRIAFATIVMGAFLFITLFIPFSNTYIKLLIQITGSIFIYYLLSLFTKEDVSLISIGVAKRFLFKRARI